MRILRELALLLFLLGLMAAAVFAVWRWWPSSPGVLQVQSSTPASLSDRAETKLRDLIRREVRIEALKDEELMAGVRQIQARLAPSLGDTPFAIEVFIVDAPTVNAVCLPGGLIVIYSGLLRRLSSADELAAILAHEMAHAVRRDPMAALKRELGIAALFALAGGQSDQVTGRILRQLLSSRYSRETEREADRQAYRLLQASQLDPGLLGAALSRIQGDGEEAKIPEVLTYLDTHPDINDRIAEAQAASRSWHGQSQPLAVDWDKFRSRFRVF